MYVLIGIRKDKSKPVSTITNSETFEDLIKNDYMEHNYNKYEFLGIIQIIDDFANQVRPVEYTPPVHEPKFGTLRAI